MNSYSMQLSELLGYLPGLNSSTADQFDILISDIALDSRNVTSGSLFCAYPGGQSDGRDYIQQAVKAGAVAVICEADNFEAPIIGGIPIIPIVGLQTKVGLLAHCFYDKPSESLQIFGVTGTNGKTTCCYLLMQAFNSLGLRSAMIGTIGIGELSNMSYSRHTTPDPIALHRQLAVWRDQGVSQVCMEVSSHALDQARVAGVIFYCTLFTNLTHDHLDYHGDMEQYAQAKRRLFTDYASQLLVSNAEDPMGSDLIESANTEFVVSYGENGDVFAEEVELDQAGISAHIIANDVDFSIKTRLIGRVNVANLLLLIATLLALSVSIEEIQEVVNKLEAAPGRMELYAGVNANSPRVVVDYAHTPDALEKALLSIREHCDGKLWCVFGCGGDRDRVKRAVMGSIADRYADQIIITNDNPRTEEPQNIADDIMMGVQGDAQVILDRAQAIARAIEQADEQDLILLAGKGHETTQQIGDQMLAFSDRQHVEQLLGLVA